MHRQILGLGPGEPLKGDHKNRKDTLDNTDENIRPGTKEDQEHNKGKYRNNTSGYKGVTFCKQTGRWIAQITVNGKHKHLGRFNTREEAYAAYCVAARELHGEFAGF